MVDLALASAWSLWSLAEATSFACDQMVRVRKRVRKEKVRRKRLCLRKGGRPVVMDIVSLGLLSW